MSQSLRARPRTAQEAQHLARARVRIAENFAHREPERDPAGRDESAVSSTISLRLLGCPVVMLEAVHEAFHRRDAMRFVIHHYAKVEGIKVSKPKRRKSRPT